METRKTTQTSILIMVLLTIILAAPVAAQAGRGHGHHHGHHHHHHHINGYGVIYNQSPGYYQPYYPQPRYNYNYSYPAPVYGPLPPQMIMGIDTGNMGFMIRF